MPPQHVEIAETVAALRRKLRRDKEGERDDSKGSSSRSSFRLKITAGAAISNPSAPTSQTTQFASNRGNKLKPGVRYVHAGSLPYRSGLTGYRETVNHAGYSRQILERNPPRTNEYGDELEDSDEDPEADADAEDENPYADVKLEELLRPLTHPSELANHPAMAQAYLDPALPEMVAATDAKIREERNNLWRAKNLYRHFIGDESWIPCGRAEHPGDWQLFEPNPSSMSNGRLSSGESPSKRRRLEADNLPNGDADGDVQIADAPGEANATDEVAGADHDSRNNGMDDSMVDGEKGDEDADVAMEDTSHPKTNGIHKQDEVGESNSINAGQETLPNESGQQHDPMVDSDLDDTKLPQGASQEPPQDMTDDPNSKENEENHQSSSPISTPPLPTRRITRALAAEGATPQIASPPPTSPTLSIQSPSLLEPHPFFLLPPSLAAYHAPHPSHPLPLHLAHSGLPPDELLETRKLLSLYIQKSEETIRGLESIYAKLFKAKRRRDQVWEWCIAEGHVGEMSDGEDWVDVDKWGLTREELRKGRDEDQGGEVTGNGGDEEGGGGGAGGGVVMGGRKGKRRRAAAGGKEKEKERDGGREREKDKEKDKEKEKE